jgi:DNA polymerase-4
MGGFDEHIAHLDMDAFFVEVERLRRPELKGKPVVVGGGGNRGVVAAASYEARRYGVRSAMPMVHARRLAPSAVVVTPDHDEYRTTSTELFGILDRFSPIVEPLSIDEAFLEISGLRRHYASPRACADAMRAAIRGELGLPSSVGISTTKFLAKMASRDAKPDGVYVVEAGSELAFLHPKPVGDLWGVGEATRARIEELGVATIGDLASFPRATLVGRLGDAIGGSLWDLAHGQDTRLVGDGAASRSISVEQTYEVDLTTDEELHRELLAHADRLSGRLRSAGYVTSTVTLKVRYPDFTTVSRSHTFAEPIATSAEVVAAARSLLSQTDAVERGVRLLGIGADALVGSDEPRQLGFESATWEALDGTVAEIRARFGSDAVSRARLAQSDPPDTDRPPSRKERGSV